MGFFSRATPGFAFVAPRLAIGSKPPLDARIERFDAIVLCAREYQPAAIEFAPDGPEIFHVPLGDWKPSADEVSLAVMAGRDVAALTRAGCSVLSTCWAGLNRSSLVAGISMVENGARASDVISKIRGARGEAALSNRYFVRIICAYDMQLRGY